MIHKQAEVAIMKNKINLSIFILVALCLSLVACTKDKKSDEAKSESAVDLSISEEKPDDENKDSLDDLDNSDSQGNDNQNDEEQEDETTESEEAVNARNDAYDDAIRAFIDEGRIPPYEEEYFEEPSEINQYAVCDINSDGKDELLIRVNEGDMDSLSIYVFLYEDDELKQIGTFFSDDRTTFYDNNVVTAPFSHGLANWGDDFRGMDICIYNDELEEYEYRYLTDAWDSSAKDTWRGDEETFPDYADKDENGMVYWIIEYINDEYIESEPMDDEEYFAWLNELTKDADVINIPWKNAVYKK